MRERTAPVHVDDLLAPVVVQNLDRGQEPLVVFHDPNFCWFVDEVGAHILEQHLEGGQIFFRVSAARIIRNAITPRFKEGNYDKGVIDGAAQTIVAESDPDDEVATASARSFSSLENSLSAVGLGRSGTI